MKNIALVILVSMVLISCGSTGESKTLDELLAAPEVVQIEGHTYTLRAYLWRDFMPGNSDSRMIALVTISEKHENPVLSGLDATSLWVINRNEVWNTNFSDESRPSGLVHEFEKIARGGPVWDTGINVDVVVMLVDGEGREYLLKVSNQLIRATS